MSWLQPCGVPFSPSPTLHQAWPLPVFSIRPQPSSVPGGGRNREVDSPLTLANSGIAEGGVPTRKAPFLLPPPFHTLSRVLPGAAPQALPPPSPNTFSSSRWAETAKLGQKPPPLTPVLWEIGRQGDHCCHHRPRRQFKQRTWSGSRNTGCS